LNFLIEETSTGFMDLEQLTAFDRIVREGSFSRAARELHLAQPTISARIQALEQEVGGSLLVRSNHGATLTTLGINLSSELNSRREKG
jgi:DNA-binding transcriptional LysR family regulator